MNCLRLLSSIYPKRINKQLVCKKIFSVNYAMHHPSRFEDVQNSWREKDGISRRYQLIYKAPMGELLKYATAYLTLSTTTVGALGIYYAGFVFDSSQMNLPVVLGDDVVIANSGSECLVYLGAFVAFHIAIKVVLSKYVVRLYQDGDKYIAVYRGNWFNSIVKHEFDLNDVKKLKPTLLIAWGDARFSLGNKHGIVLENYFKSPEYYNRLVYRNRKSYERDAKDD